MNCNRAEKWILLAEAGELSLLRRLRLERHLLSCERCRAFKVDVDRIGQVALTAVPANVPGAAVMSAIRAEARRAVASRQGVGDVLYVRPLLRFGWPAVAVCAALLVAVSVGVHLWFNYARSLRMQAEELAGAKRSLTTEHGTAAAHMTDLFVEDICTVEQLADLLKRQDINDLDRDLMVLDGLAI